MMIAEILEIILWEVLSVLMATPSSFSTNFIIDLLNKSKDDHKMDNRENFDGYPRQPYLRRICENLIRIMEDESSNFRLSPYIMPGICELYPLDQYLQSLGRILRNIDRKVKMYPSFSLPLGLSSKIISWLTLSSNEVYIQKSKNPNIISLPRVLFAEFVNQINLIGPRGILYLLGIRSTIGSADIVPFDIHLLVSSFNAVHTSQPSGEKKSSPLTVGARALCKHSHRSSEGFWGQCKGSELIKNQIALAKLFQLLESCVWINLHKMGGLNDPSEIVVEIRVQEGYGARWLAKIDEPTDTTADGSENRFPFGTFTIKFRGFVEPMMENGHELGWKH